jgi:hypothetical protein
MKTGAPLLIGLSFLAGERWQLEAAFNTRAAFSYLVLIDSSGRSTMLPASSR